MTRDVVRVRIPEVHEYDVVFEDGEAVFVGAVIRRPASKRGPKAGQVVDTHRTTWDARGSGYGSTADKIIRIAQADLAADTAIRPSATPAQVDRPHIPLIVGSPHNSPAAAIHQRRHRRA